MTRIFAMALASAALLAAPQVSAQQTDTRTTGVSHDDLDLGTKEGQDELERRIDRAAKSVCGMHERATGSNRIPREARDCYRDAKRQLDRHFAQLVENAQTQAGG